MAYEKADFYANYGFWAIDPVTRHKFARFKSPNIAGGVEITCRLHYHPAAVKKLKATMAQRLVDHFIAQGDPLTADDVLVVIGGAFGWLGEALEDLVPGLVACSVDLSDYVQLVKDQSPDDELIESIEAEGNTITDGGPGQYLYDKFKDPNPRSRNPNRVIKETLANNGSRNRVRAKLPRNVTRCITEEVWQLITPQEQQTYTDAAAAWGVPLTHIIDGAII